MDSELIAVSGVESDTKKVNYGASDTDGPYEYNEIIERIGLGRSQLQIAFMATVAQCADGMEIMCLSFLAVQVQCDPALQATSLQASLLITIAYGGMFFGSFIFGKLADKCGRKTSVLVGLSIVFVSGALSAVARSMIELYVVRFVTGVGVGSCCQLLTQTAEFLPVMYRGEILIVVDGLFSIGSLIESVLALVFLPTIGWRSFVFFTALPVLPIIIIYALVMPESPRYLLISNQQHKTKCILERLALTNGKNVPEIHSFCMHQVHEEPVRGNIRDMFDSDYRRTSILLCLLWPIGQIAYYGSVQFNTLYVAASDLSQSRLEVSLCCSFVLTRILTRKQTIGSAFTFFSTMMGLIWATQNLQSPAVTSLLFGLARALGLTANASVQVYTQEVYPTYIRGVSTGTLNASSRIGMASTPLLLLIAQSIWPNLPFVVFILVGVLGVIASQLLRIETKHCSMKDS